MDEINDVILEDEGDEPRLGRIRTRSDHMTRQASRRAHALHREIRRDEGEEEDAECERHKSALWNQHG